MFLWSLGRQGEEGGPTTLPSKFAGLLSTTQDRAARGGRAVAVDRMVEGQAEGTGASQLAVLGNQANLPTWLMRQFTRMARFRRGRKGTGA